MLRQPLYSRLGHEFFRGQGFGGQLYLLAPPKITAVIKHQITSKSVGGQTLRLGRKLIPSGVLIAYRSYSILIFGFL